MRQKNSTSRLEWLCSSGKMRMESTAACGFDALLKCQTTIESSEPNLTVDTLCDGIFISPLMQLNAGSHEINTENNEIILFFIKIYSHEYVTK